MIAGAAIAAALTPTAMAWLLLPFFAWQFFHFAKQNLGMTALAAMTAGVPPLQAAERRALITSGAAGIGALMARPRCCRCASILGWAHCSRYRRRRWRVPSPPA